RRARRRDGEGDASDVVARWRKSIAQPRPRRAVVDAPPDAALRPIGAAIRRPAQALPGGAVDGLRVSGIDGDVDRARGVAHEQHLAPGLAAILAAIETAVGTRRVLRSHGGDEDAIRIRRIDAHARDAARLGEAEAGPAGATIRAAKQSGAIVGVGG